jgi:asparagine synthetase A
MVYGWDWTLVVIRDSPELGNLRPVIQDIFEKVIQKEVDFDIIYNFYI